MIVATLRPRPQGSVGTRTICGKLRDADSGRQVACKIPASWRVGLRLRSDRDSEPFDYFFEQLKVCNHCRRQLTVEQVQTSNTFHHVSRKLVGWNRHPPKRRLTVLVFRHLVMGFDSGG